MLSHLLSRVDDPVPLVVQGRSVLGAEAVARQVAALWQRIAPSGPSRLTLVHPVDLSRRGRATVERHLVELLPAATSVRWVSRAAAAVAAVAECADLDPDDRVAILHVGGSSVEAVVGTTATLSSGAVHAVRVDRGGAGHAVDDSLLVALRNGRDLGRVGEPSPRIWPACGASANAPRSPCRRRLPSTSTSTVCPCVWFAPTSRS